MPLLISLAVLVFLGFIGVPALQEGGAVHEAEAPVFPPGNLTVHFLDVGQGMSALLISDGHAMLIDGGGRDTSSFVVSYLRNQGIESLDYVIASHFDEDHIAGLIGVLHTMQVRAVIQPVYEADTKIFASFLEAETGVPVRTPRTGALGELIESSAAVPESVVLGKAYPFGSAYFTVLGPVSYAHDLANDNSLVIRVSCGSRHFLFMGDAETSAEEELLGGGFSLKADVLSVGHHGSSDSSTEAFLKAVRPEIAVISCGADNPYGHPHEETLDRLKAIGARILRTDQEGTILLRTDGTSLERVEGEA